MNVEQQQYFKQLLLDKRKELLGEINLIKVEEEELSLKEEDGDNSSYPYHLADQGSDNSAQELNFFHAHRDSRLLYHIDEALEKIEHGEYGWCEICGQSIGWDRLEAVPHARLCIQCKCKEEGPDERTNGLRGRDSSVLEDMYEDTT